MSKGNKRYCQCCAETNQQGLEIKEAKLESGLEKFRVKNPFRFFGLPTYTPRQPLLAARTRIFPRASMAVAGSTSSKNWFASATSPTRQGLGREHLAQNPRGWECFNLARPWCKRRAASSSPQTSAPGDTFSMMRSIPRHMRLQASFLGHALYEQIFLAQECLALMHTLPIFLTSCEALTFNGNISLRKQPRPRHHAKPSCQLWSKYAQQSGHY